jgi:hypothetical protein
MIMPDVADYRVISDGGVTIQTGGDIDHTFTFDLGTAVKHNQSQVLQWFYVSSSNANNLSYRISINGTAVRTINVTGNFFSTIHEICANVTHNGSNECEIKIVGGSGSVTISDIVLFVQVGV